MAQDHVASVTSASRQSKTNLPGPSPWLGARGGYSSEDLTSIQIAYSDREVARPDQLIGVNEVLELRIHGVGGASPATNLETPTTLMVAGDQTAGFYRAWFPGQSSARTPLREAYCWGKFNYAAATSAAWLLLLPFALVNLASWALPAPQKQSEGPVQDWRTKRRRSRVVLRLLGLVLTSAFFITLCYLLVDVVAQPTSNAKAPKWLRWFGKMTEPSHREATALAIAVFIAAVLRRFSKVTTGRYEEKWLPGTDLPELPEMRLSAQGMWAGGESVRRQRLCHVLGACAVIFAFTALAFGPDSSERRIGTTVAVGMGAFAVVVLIMPGCDRLWVDARQWALPHNVQVVVEVIAWLATISAPVYVWFARPAISSDRYGHAVRLLHAPVYFEFVLLLVLAGLVAHKPRKQSDVFAGGYLSLVFAGLAVAVSTIFGGSLLIAATRVFTDTTTEYRITREMAPGSLAFDVAILTAIFIVAPWIYVRRKILTNKLIEGLVTPAEDGWKPQDIPVSKSYSVPPGSPIHSTAVKRVAGIWATSRMTDHAGTGAAVLTMFTLVGLFAAQYCINIGEYDWLLKGAQVGSILTVAATGALIGFLRGALTSEEKRRRFGFFWDVVNFWPRAAHPFAPPCYAERAVPEVTTRIRRIVGDIERNHLAPDPAVSQVECERDDNNMDCFEPHRPVVLNGYSQGAPISIAVVAQLPGDCHKKLALLTLACPAHRLYGRAFPLYFGPDQLQILLDNKLTNTDETTRRWINLCRRSDYIGGPIGMKLDQWILDPPALWSNSNPTPPPAHLHSDWFPDPQTRPSVAALRRILLVEKSD